MRARRSLWVAALLAAAPAPALAQDMCASLDRIAAASRDRPAFASLRRAAWDGTLVPGYRDRDCTITPGIRVLCYRNLAPASLELDAIGRALRDCLGREPVLRPDREGRTYGDPDLLFVVRGLRYRVNNHCDRHCRAGLITSFEISFERARRRR
jgi:hypothetical protein